MYQGHIDGLVQDCSNSIANALELRLSCTNPSIYNYDHLKAKLSCKHILEMLLEQIQSFCTSHLIFLIAKAI